MHSFQFVVACLALFASHLVAQERTVAITVDDLPYATGPAAGDPAADIPAAEEANRRLLTAFHARHVPFTGFVIQKRVEDLGSTGPVLLQQWIRAGLDLGNHTYSHPDLNALSVEEIEDQIVRGELLIAPMMKQARRKLQFFRFPMNHTGDTKEKHDALAAFLKQRGYQLATCTIDNSDYLFNVAYLRMLAAHDTAQAQKLTRVYLAFTANVIDYSAGLNKEVIGYEPPEVMLLHDNRLNGEVIDELLKLFTIRRYRFVSLSTAQADPAYQTPETYITRFGPMWGYRWAAERKIKVDGSLEPDPPKWVLDYGKPENGK